MQVTSVSSVVPATPTPPLAVAIPAYTSITTHDAVAISFRHACPWALPASSAYVPLFREPAELADGLAPKERRYGPDIVGPIRPKERLSTPFQRFPAPRGRRGIRQVLRRQYAPARQSSIISRPRVPAQLPRWLSRVAAH